jgi:hypothetical protein
VAPLMQRTRRGAPTCLRDVGRRSRFRGQGSLRVGLDSGRVRCEGSCRQTRWLFGVAGFGISGDRDSRGLCARVKAKPNDAARRLGEEAAERGLSDARMDVARVRQGGKRLQDLVDQLAATASAELHDGGADGRLQRSPESNDLESGRPSSRAHRCTRALEPLTSASTSARLAVEVSPGVVIASAP